MPGDSNKDYIERARKKIRASGYLENLEQFINGELELTTTQVNAMFNLLDRVLPKIAQQQLIVEDKRDRGPREMTLAELQQEWDERREEQPPLH